jgi:ribosome-associated protein
MTARRTSTNCPTAWISVADPILINEELSIPGEEIHFTYSRSGGPGGQNVNKVSSRVTLTFDLRRAACLSEDQRRRISKKLATRINKDGVLRIVSQQTRSQELNREDALARFAEILRQALVVARPRVKARIPGIAHQRRLDEKKKRTLIKQGRSRKDWQ